MQYGGKDVGHFVKSPAIQRQHLDPHPHLGRLNNEVEIAWWLGTWESESATLTYKPGAGEDEENTPAVAGREGLGDGSLLLQGWTGLEPGENRYI